MSSELKIISNRANAQLSTGPRSSHGKRISSQNATRHGFSSATLYVAPQDQPEFQAFEAERRLAHIPIGPTEEDWFRQLLQSAWTLHKISLAEAQVTSEPDAFLNPDRFALIERYQRYRQSHQRSYERAFRQLQLLQSDRAVRSLPHHEGLQDLPVAVPAKRYAAYVTKRSQTQSLVQFVPAHQPKQPITQAQAVTQAGSPLEPTSEAVLP